MRLKKYILFILIGLFTFSVCLPVTAGGRTNYHSKVAKKKAASKKKKIQKNKDSKGKSPQSRKTKRIFFPFA